MFDVGRWLGSMALFCCASSHQRTVLGSSLQGLGRLGEAKCRSYPRQLA